MAGRSAALIAWATSGDNFTPSPPGYPVASSMTIVPLPSRAVTFWIAVGPSLPIAAVLNPLALAA